jgi:hypothetical protein
MRNFLSFFIGLTCLSATQAQPVVSLRIADLWLEETNIPGFPAFHSGAVGQHEGKWIIMAGRTNGMHGFYPPFAFPGNGRQLNVYVVDPEEGNIWSVPNDGITDVRIREQLSSSNMQFAQRNDKLYITGGYGYMNAIDDFTTFPYLTSADMGCLTDSVIAGGDINSCFNVTEDSLFAVAGGRMGRIDERYFLVFGHYFHHRYSVADLGSFIQRYTFQIRMFDLADSNSVFEPQNVQVVTDSVNFRRRDFNMTPFEEGNEKGFYAWSGVFRDSVDLPHYTPVRIKSDGTYEVLPFEQKLAHYHSGSFSFKTNSPGDMGGQNMHVFLGGMAEYYPDQNNQISQDSLVPFTKQFSSVQKNTFSGEISEYYHGVILYPEDYCNYFQPGQIRFAFNEYEGTNAEFIPNPDLVSEQTGVVLDTSIFLSETPLLLGYVIGGIHSTGPNIADMNDPSLSFASDRIYKVYYTMRTCADIKESAVSRVGLFPNPTSETIRVDTDDELKTLIITDAAGKTVRSQAGQIAYVLYVGDLAPGVYFLQAQTNEKALRATFVKQ